MNTLQETTMVSNIYKSKGKTNHQVAHALVIGFTGQLKGWWDNTLTEGNRTWLKQAFKKEANGQAVKNERGERIEDAVNSLIFAITKHFIGDPDKYREESFDRLVILKCPKLSDFRWYKDVFLSKVLVRSANSQPYWKEKFIGGLPKHFAYQVRERLFNEGHTDFTNVTCGEIINTIERLGSLNLCNDYEKTLGQELV